MNRIIFKPIDHRTGMALTLFGLLLLLLLGAFIAVRPAQAAFNKDSIISDADFTDTVTMNETQIQDFLVAHGSYLAGYVEAGTPLIGPRDDVSAHGWSAAHIIWQVANWYGINPQVILTTLQKEQSLVTNPAPTQTALDAAMGYNCPDIGGCSPADKGFALQVDHGTWQLWYNMYHANLNDGTVGVYFTGNTITVDNSSVNVYLTNGATAALYRYTPHIWGNQLFFNIFQNWFFTLNSTSPAKDATGVFDLTQVTASFSRPLDPATLTADSFRLVRHRDAAVVSSNISLNDNNRTVSLTPSNPLDPYTIYDATITTAVTDLDGHHLPADHSWSFTTGPVSRSYYWTWYDDVSMRDWVMMAAPAGQLGFGLSVGGNPQALADSFGLGAGRVPAGSSLAFISSGLVGGPVRASSVTGDSAIVSQRILMGNSFEEVLGTDSGKLSNHYYWTWYDQHSPGMTDWVLLANPSDTPVTYQINIAGTLMPPSTANPGTIPAHGKVTPTFAGVIGGPVEVTSVGGNVIASQRVLSNFGTAFNEVPGIPAGDLSNHYYWTWYDQHSPGMTDWVLLANPTNAEVTYQINIAGTLMPRSTANPGTIPAHGKVTPTFAGVIGGPVEVTSVGGNVIASQRVIAGPSFEEVPGYRATDLATGYRWTWYDQQSAGVTDWVLVDNPGGTQVNYVIKIGGATMPVSVANPGTIPAHGRVTPTFPGKMAGPVEVTADGNIMVSQRVLWNGFFNEVLGQ
ncbi:MAG: Ig-like domain-containing domain [Thermoleophilia bacterium]